MPSGCVGVGSGIANPAVRIPCRRNRNLHHIPPASRRQLMVDVIEVLTQLAGG